MKLRTTYRDGVGNRRIGSDEDSQIQFDDVELATLIKAIERLHSEPGFAQVELSDGQSSVDIADSGDGQTFFIEQYFDLIYGGIYDSRETIQILTRISEGLTSEELRDLFPTLNGELIYEYDPIKAEKIPKMSRIPMNVRNALAPPPENQG
jgi:hypothetical protein